MPNTPSQGGLNFILLFASLITFQVFEYSSALARGSKTYQKEKKPPAIQVESFPILIFDLSQTYELMLIENSQI